MDTSFDQREGSMETAVAAVGVMMDDGIAISMPRLATPASPQARASAAPAHDSDTGSALVLRILDELDYGLMLVTCNAAVRFANRVALRQCSATHAMRLHEGHVRPRHDGEQAAFTRALAAAMQGRRSMLTLRSQGASVSLAVVPVADPEPNGTAVTLLVFGRHQVCEPLSVEFFAREHRLTAAEGVVLRKLCDGVVPARIAVECGVALSTVRTQVGSVRLKTGARSIGDLVRRVTMLPPMVSVLN
jgi:DNA-binding CsgD family transcriptional regulator